MTLRSFSDKLSIINRSNKTEGSKRYLFLLELLVIATAYVISVEFWNKYINFTVKFNYEYLILGAIYMISWALILKLTIVAKVPRTQRYRTILFNFIRISFIQLIIVLLAKYLLGFILISNKFVMATAFVNLIVIVNLRMFLFSVFKKYRARGYDLHRVMIYANAFSDAFVEKIINEKEWGFKVVKIVSNSRLIKAKFGDRIQVIPESSDIKKILDEEVIDELIYTKSIADQKQIHDLINFCNEVGIIFRMQSNFSPLKNLRLHLNTLNNSSQLSLTDTPDNNFSQFFKYLADLYFSFFMMILLSPILGIIALLIRLDSKGPVIFRQERVGLRGRRFILYKFRTMNLDAEKMLSKLKFKNEVDGPVFKIREDPRITRIGRFLRRTNLDELPQLYNVFRGEMSLIGPRPPLPEEVAQYERWQLRRLSVRPGITCTWQVIPNRNNIKFENWMKMDLQYIDKWSIRKDVGLFFKTIKTFFTATGY